MRTFGGWVVIAACGSVLACNGLTDDTTGAPAPAETSKPPTGTPATDPGSGSGPLSSASPSTCAPGSPTTGRFDPDRVYAFGSGAPGVGLAVFLPSDPSNIAVGLGNVSGPPMLIRPSDCRLVYAKGFEIVEYGNSTTPGKTLGSLPCTGMLAGLFPDDGAIVYRCEGDAPRYGILGSSEVVDFAGYPPVAFGPGRVSLGGGGTPSLAVVRDGVATPVSGVDVTGTIVAARSRAGGGFLFVIKQANHARSLYEVDLAGKATKRETYPARPDPESFSECALESSGALVCTEIIADGNKFGVTKSFNGAREIVYDRQDGPVYFYGHHPLSGP